MFPGQGSQYVGMGRELFDNFKKARDVFEEASDTIKINLSRLAFEGPEDKLNLTANTQPAILAVSIAALEVLESETAVKADFLAGHSLGEYSALACSGLFNFSDSLRIVRKRGALMQKAVPEGEGAMAAILGMDKGDVSSVCIDAEGGGEIVSPANFNSPGQIVISGNRKAVERAAELAKERGAKRALLLSVSVPSHCKLMEDAALSLRREIEDLQLGNLNIPVVSNVDAVAYPSKDDAVDLLMRQLSSPVRWDDSIRYLINKGVETFIEVGPGRVLGGLVKRIDRSVDIFNIDDPASLKSLSQKIKKEGEICN